MRISNWVNREEYPFESKYLPVRGGRLHYIDEGRGKPFVMVHGFPTWSFLFRHLIKGLSSDYRCVALDHLGFGLSDKLPGWSYLPEAHAQNFKALMEHLNLKDITLLVHGFGGPIALPYAIEEPQKMTQLILINTWLWSLKGEPAAEKIARMAASPIGHNLYERLNYAPKVLMKQAIADKSKLPAAIQQQYEKPFSTPNERKGALVLAQELVNSGDWFERQWRLRDRIKSIPALLLWGMQDTVFLPKDLHAWQELFTHNHMIRFQKSGHFVPEEVGAQLAPLLLDFLQEPPGK